MDRTELACDIIDELGRRFVTILRENAAKLVEGDLDEIEQCLQGVGRQVLGPVVEEAVSIIAAARVDERPSCLECGQAMRLVDYRRPRVLQGLVGNYSLVRAYYFCDHCQLGRAPVDEYLGIGSGSLSPGLERVTCWFGISDSFEEAARALHETMRIELVDETVRRETEGIGQVAEDEEQHAIALAQAGKEPLPPEVINAESPVLLVEVDGAMVHEVDGEWHEVKSGLAAPLGPELQEDDKTGRTTLKMGKPSYCAGFESGELFWYRAYVEACRRGLGTALVTLVVLLGDGADWIWRYGSAFLAVAGVKLIEIVDIYHAFKHLGTVADAVFGQGSPAAIGWVEPLKKKLEAEGPGPIMAALAGLKPQDEGGANEVRKAIGYFRENMARMDYPRFLALHLPIGSGAIESACKTLVEKREKGPGMRWTESGAQEVVSLRALSRSGRWDAFWKTHPQRRRPPVFAPRRPGSTPLTVNSRRAA